MIASISDYDNPSFSEQKYAEHYNIPKPKPHLVLRPLPEDPEEALQQGYKHPTQKKPSKMKAFWKNKVEPGWGKFKNKVRSIFKRKHQGKDKPTQDTHANTVASFEEQLDTCRQRLLSGAADQTATIQALVQLAMKYPEHAQEILDLFDEWAPQVISRLDTLFNEAVKARSLPRDFIALLDSMDAFFYAITHLNSLRSTQAYRDFIELLTSRRLIEWFSILAQIKGVNLQKLQTIVYRLRARFRSPELQQLMDQIAGMIQQHIS